jgi:hypothetical protein
MAAAGTEVALTYRTNRVSAETLAESLPADFAEPGVGDADDGDLGDGFVARQDVFDLGRVGVEAADDVHVFLRSVMRR